MLALDSVQRELAGGLLGLDARQIKLLKEWARLGDSPSDKAKFDFIAANLALLDREQARRACLALLPAYPQGLKPYTQLFGPLPPFEAQRLKALRAERTETGSPMPCTIGRPASTCCSRTPATPTTGYRRR